MVLVTALLGLPQIDSWESFYTYDGGGWGISVTAHDVNDDGLKDLLFAGDSINIEYMANNGSNFTAGPVFMADGSELIVNTC